MNGAIKRTVHTNTNEEQTWLPYTHSTHQSVVCVRVYYVCVWVLVSTMKESRKRRSGIEKTFASITGPADAILMHSAWIHIPIHAWMNTRTLIQLNTQNVDSKKVRSFAYPHARVYMCVWYVRYVRMYVCMRSMHDAQRCQLYREWIWDTRDPTAQAKNTQWILINQRLKR